MTYLSYMKYIISETQKEYIWLLRRIETPEILEQFEDILSESLWSEVTDPCDYMDNRDGFVYDVIRKSVTTLLFSYENEMTGEYYGIEKKPWFDEFEEFLIDMMMDKYGKKVYKVYDDNIEDCL